VLLDVNGGLVLSANPVGARIWDLLEQALTPVEIARRLAAEYAMPLDRVERDVALFVAELISRGLIAGDPRR
jgi:hypothetical protein